MNLLQRKADAKDGNPRGNGTKVGFFIKLPKELAELFPDLGSEDQSPPHITFLYVGDVPEERRAEFHKVVEGAFEEIRGPVRAYLDHLDHFVHPAQERNVAIVRARFSHDLSSLRWRLRERLIDAGFDVLDSFPLVYSPHVTLAYLPGRDSYWEKPVPRGWWDFDEIEVWGMPQVKKIPFGKVGSDRQASTPLVTVDGVSLKYRLKADSRGIVAMAYAGTKRIGHLQAFEQLYPERHACADDVWKLLGRFPQVEDTSRPCFHPKGEERAWTNTRALAVYKAFVDVAWQGKGVGKALYQAVMAEWFDRVGPFLFMPMACTIGSGTSAMARGVWANLAQMYPSSGDVLAVVRRPQVSRQASGAHAKSIALMKFLSGIALRLGAAKHVYVVGGAVRNFVLGEPIKDLDVVIDSVALGKDSEWFAKAVQREIPVATNLTTNQYGVTILTVKGDWELGGSNLRGEVIEIANARKESYGGAEGKGYKPHSVSPATIEEDIRRRDFTFNTLLWRMADLAEGPDKAEIVDILGCGLEDLRSRDLRCPGDDPDRTFRDDPTRLLRVIRMYVKYGLRPTPDTEAAIRRSAPLLKRAPPNAILGVLLKVLDGD